MKRSKPTQVLPFVMMAVLGFWTASCSFDHNQRNYGPPDDVSMLVSDATPQAGWSGNMQSGTATYCPDASQDTQNYYAFSFENGICQKAVYSVVYPSEDAARGMEMAFCDGSWALTRTVVNKLQDLALSVYRTGRVLYVIIDCLKGKSCEDVKSLVVYWEGKDVLVPNRLIIGAWDDADGRYVHQNLFGLGIDFEVATTYDNEVLNSYVSTVTFPNLSWAQALNEELSMKIVRIVEQFGQQATTSLSDMVIQVKIEHPSAMTKSQTYQMTAVFDWVFSRPYFVIYHH